MTKTDTILALLGAGKHTRAQIVAATDWSSVDLKRIAASRGLTITKGADGILSTRRVAVFRVTVEQLSA